jgi:hypothetical protein
MAEELAGLCGMSTKHQAGAVQWLKSLDARADSRAEAKRRAAGAHCAASPCPGRANTPTGIS